VKQQKKKGMDGKGIVRRAVRNGGCQAVEWAGQSAYDYEGWDKEKGKGLYEEVVKVKSSKTEGRPFGLAAAGQGSSGVRSLRENRSYGGKKSRVVRQFDGGLESSGRTYQEA